MNAEHPDADILLSSLVPLRHALLRDGFLQAIRAMDEFELSVAQMATLMLLEAEGSATVGSLASDLGRSLSATSRLIDQMVRRDLLTRHEDDRDRRVKRVMLTARGTDLIGQVQRQRAEAQRAVMAALSASEQAEVMRGMTLLAEAARRRTAAQVEPARQDSPTASSPTGEASTGNRGDTAPTANTAKERSAMPTPFSAISRP